LISLYPENHSVKRYLGEFLDIATLAETEFEALEPTFERQGWELPFSLKFAIGARLDSKPRKHLKATYRAASSEFEGTLNPTADGKPVPDISGLRKPVEIAQEVADEVIDDLDKLSRYLGRNPDGRGSIEAHALLPLDLWSLFPSTEMEALKEWARGVMQSGGLIPLADVIEKLEGQRSTKLWFCLISASRSRSWKMFRQTIRQR